MTDFMAKMHQIRFRLGLRPRPRWGSLQRSPRPPSWIWGPTSKGREGERRVGKGRGREGRQGEGKGRAGERSHCSCFTKRPLCGGVMSPQLLWERRPCKYILELAYTYIVHTVILNNKKLSCRRETARCIVSVYISLSHRR